MEGNQGTKAGAAVSIVAAVTSNIDALEQFVRIGASVVAIISGSVVIFFTVKDRIKRTKHEKRKKD